MHRWMGMRMEVGQYLSDNWNEKMNIHLLTGSLGHCSPEYHSFDPCPMPYQHVCMCIYILYIYIHPDSVAIYTYTLHICLLCFAYIHYMCIYLSTWQVPSTSWWKLSNLAELTNNPRVLMALLSVRARPFFYDFLTPHWFDQSANHQSRWFFEKYNPLWRFTDTTLYAYIATPKESKQNNSY
jgi:hypothetical protein